MDKLTDIISILYTSRELDECISKVVAPRHRDDFKQELFLILLEKPPQEIVRIAETGKLLYYVVRIILNLSRQERNIYHTKYLDKKTEYNTDRVLQSCEEELGIEERQEKETAEDAALYEFRLMDDKLRPGGFPYYRSLVELVVKYGSLREAEQATGIPRSTLHDTIVKVRNYLK